MVTRLPSPPRKVAAAPQKTVPAEPPKPQTNPPSTPYLQGPRVTTNNPWRDLHPARVWPD